MNAGRKEGRNEGRNEWMIVYDMCVCVCVSKKQADPRHNEDLAHHGIQLVQRLVDRLPVEASRDGHEASGHGGPQVTPEEEPQLGSKSHRKAIKNAKITEKQRGSPCKGLVGVAKCKQCKLFPKLSLAACPVKSNGSLHGCNILMDFTGPFVQPF